MPMRCIRSGCCACADAAIGNAAAAPPSRVMNSRRLMCCLNPSIAAYHSVIGNSALCITASWAAQCVSGSVKPGLPPWRPHVRFRRVQTLVRDVRRCSSCAIPIRAPAPSAGAVPLGEAVELLHDTNVIRQHRDLILRRSPPRLSATTACRSSGALPISRVPQTSP